MDSYEIVMTPDSMSDLIEIKDYIAYALLAPDTALAYIQLIRKEIESLSTMPERNALVEDEPWHTRGIRKIIVKNFYVYYLVDKDTMRIYILNVIYAKRDQLNMLEKIGDI